MGNPRPISWEHDKTWRLLLHLAMNATTGAVVHLTPTLVDAFAAHARLLWLVNVGWKACGTRWR